MSDFPITTEREGDRDREIGEARAMIFAATELGNRRMPFTFHPSTMAWLLDAAERAERYEKALEDILAYARGSIGTVRLGAALRICEQEALEALRGGSAPEGAEP